MNDIKFKPIGIIYSPFNEPHGVPIQPSGAKGIEGSIEVFPGYVEGLTDIEGFSHIILIYYFHLSKNTSLTVIPYLDSHVRGVFSTRAPGRPNHVGISVAELTKVEGKRLYVKDIDIVDGTPLLDIKPYVPQFDSRDTLKIGWLENVIHNLPNSKDDGRFVE